MVYYLMPMCYVWLGTRFHKEGTHRVQGRRREDKKEETRKKRQEGSRRRGAAAGTTGLPRR
jgi:hypothetical protein